MKSQHQHSQSLAYAYDFLGKFFVNFIFLLSKKNLSEKKCQKKILLLLCFHLSQFQTLFLGHFKSEKEIENIVKRIKLCFPGLVFLTVYNSSRQDQKILQRTNYVKKEKSFVKKNQNFLTKFFFSLFLVKSQKSLKSC